jgi:hypothetical protein
MAVSFIGGENLTQVTDKLAILDMVHIEIRSINKMHYY